MAVRVDITPEAGDDLMVAALWYVEQSRTRDLGAELLHEFSVLVERIAENPALFPFYDAPARRAILRKFPYAIYYEVEPDRAVVLGFVHMRREPGAWRR